MKQNKNNEIAVEVKNVTARFNMASEKIDNLKEYFIKLVKRLFLVLITILIQY